MRSEYTSYPYDFPNDAQAKVEREKLQAGEVFDKAKEQIPASRWGSIPDLERLLKQYILSVFAVFAHEACQLGRCGVWTVVRVHSECLDFLRGFTIEAHSDKGYDTNGNRLPFCPTEKELKNSPEWKKYEKKRGKLAKLQSAQFGTPPDTICAPAEPETAATNLSKSTTPQEAVLPGTPESYTMLSSRQAETSDELLSARDKRVHEFVGATRFSTFTNAEILKMKGIKKQLRADCQLMPGDATKSCFDRIRRAKGYPLSRKIEEKRSTQK